MFITYYINMNIYKKLNVEVNKQRYPDINFKELDIDDITPMQLKEFRTKYTKKGRPIELAVICDICKETTFKPISDIIYQVKTSTFLSDLMICKRPNSNKNPCKRKKISMINKEKKKLGISPHQGYHVSKEQYQKYIQTMTERGHYEKLRKARKGKSFEDLYGVVKTKEIKKKMADNNPRINGLLPGPRTGKPCSSEQKETARTKRHKFLTTKALELNWVDPISGKPCNYIDYMSFKAKLYWDNLSINEKALIRKKTCKAVSLPKDWNHKSWGYHTPWWRTIVEAAYDEKYQSSYELAYYLLLDDKKSFL